MSTPSKTSLDSFDFENDAFLSIFDDVDQPIDENESTMPVEELLSLLSKSVQGTPKSMDITSQTLPSPTPLRDIMNVKSSNMRNTSFTTVDQTESGLAVPISNSPRNISSISTESGRSIKFSDNASIKSDRVEVSGASAAVSNDNVGDSKQSSSATNYVTKSKPDDGKVTQNIDQINYLHSNWILTFFHVIVLAIRGVGQSKNPGNLRFRELVAERKSLYDRNSDPDYRRQLGEEIVESIKPGRFLKKDDSSQRFFRIMDHEAAVTKAMFAIRDMKPCPKGRAITTSTSSLANRKRKTVYGIGVDGSFSKTSRTSTSRMNSSSPSITSPNALTDTEVDKIREMLQDSIVGIKRSRTLNRKPSRFHQIFTRIESVASKVESDNPLQTRFDLLTRVQSSMKNGMSFHQFFDALLSQIE